MQVAAAAGLIWLGAAQGQQAENCSQLLGVGWQTIEVSGQTSAIYTAEGPGCAAASCGGRIFVCFNEAQNCYLAKADGRFPTSVPFNARQAPMGLDIRSASQCGGEDASREDRAFNVRLMSTNPGDGCLNELEVEGGEDRFFEGGKLLEMDGKPAVLVEGAGMAVLFDVEGDALRIPGFHCVHNNGACEDQYQLEVQIPLSENGGIDVKNKDTGEMIASGSVNNTCGARLSGRVAPIPTLPQYALILLIMGLLFAAVRVTRRGMSA